MFIINIVKDGVVLKTMIEYLKVTLLGEGNIEIFTNHCNIKGIIKKNSEIEFKVSGGNLEKITFDSEKVLKLNDNICRIL